MITVKEYCQVYEHGGEFQSVEHAAAGRLLGELVEMSKTNDAVAGMNLMNNILCNDLLVAGLMLGIASGIIGRNELAEEQNVRANT